MSLVIEFERVIGVREVLLGLFFDFLVGFDPIKNLGAVTREFRHRGVLCFKGFFVQRFLYQRSLSIVAGQIFAR